MKRKTSFSEKGITLVALVITIIILLILAGVTLNTVLSENGLFKRAKASAEKYDLENEKEVLSMSVTSYQTAKALNEVEQEKNKLGETLKKRDFQNTLDWHVVEVNDTTYDNGWNLVEKGTEIEGYGKAENSWLVNYETGEVIQLEENNYLSLSAGDMIAVKDNLIINVDSSIIDKGTEQSKEEIEKQLGGGITLEGFNFEDENSGLTSTSFIFDGKDDVIIIPYDSSKQINKGITLEFYGKIKGIGLLEGKNQVDHSGNILNGFFELTNKNNRFNPALKFGIDINNSKIEQLVWNIGVKHTVSEGFKGNFNDRPIDTWDRFLFSNFDINIDFNSDIYFTVTMDGDNEETKVYINGKLIIERKI